MEEPQSVVPTPNGSWRWLAAFAVSLWLLAFPAVAGAELPTRGTGLISDGVAQVGLFTADGTAVEVYDTRTGALAGRRVPLPLDRDGQQYQWFTEGLVDGRVYLGGGDEPDELIAVADSASGTFRWLCGEPDQLPEGISVPRCLRFPIVLTVPRIVRIGKRWMEVLRPSPRGGTTLIRYSDSGQRFAQRVATRDELQRYERLMKADAAVDLDASRVKEDTRFGYRVRLRNEYRLGRITDGRLAGLRTQPFTRYVAQPRRGVRGICASTGTRLVLWDQRTRRVWTRPIDRSLHRRAWNVCTRDGVIVAEATQFNIRSPADGDASSIGPLIAWPTEANDHGWRPRPKLRPGGRLTV